MTTKHTAGDDAHRFLESVDSVGGHAEKCKGFGTAFLEKQEAIPRLLRRESEGFATLSPSVHGTLVKVVHYDASCPTCNDLAGREISRRYRVQRR